MPRYITSLLDGVLSVYTWGEAEVPLPPVRKRRRSAAAAWREDAAKLRADADRVLERRERITSHA